MLVEVLVEVAFRIVPPGHDNLAHRVRQARHLRIGRVIGHPRVADRRPCIERLAGVRHRLVSRERDLFGVDQLGELAVRLEVERRLRGLEPRRPAREHGLGDPHVRGPASAVLCRSHPHFAEDLGPRAGAQRGVEQRLEVEERQQLPRRGTFTPVVDRALEVEEVDVSLLAGERTAQGVLRSAPPSGGCAPRGARRRRPSARRRGGAGRWRARPPRSCSCLRPGHTPRRCARPRRGVRQRRDRRACPFRDRANELLDLLDDDRAVIARSRGESGVDGDRDWVPHRLRECRQCRVEARRVLPKDALRSVLDAERAAP